MDEEDINMEGFDGGKIGDELTLSIEFNANPGPDEIKWYKKISQLKIILKNIIIIQLFVYFSGSCMTWINLLELNKINLMTLSVQKV